MTTFLKSPDSAEHASRQGRDRVEAVVAEIIAAVRERGAVAVREYSASLDNWEPESTPIYPWRDVPC